MENKNCAICWQPKNNLMISNPCSHPHDVEYHETCLKDWKKKSNTCPYCRNRFHTDIQVFWPCMALFVIIGVIMNIDWSQYQVEGITVLYMLVLLAQISLVMCGLFGVYALFVLGSVMMTNQVQHADQE